MSATKDELGEINGVKPRVVMKDGEERDIKSASRNSTYKVKRAFDHYYCTCPAWRNQGGHPVNARTCKHLRSLLGDAYEDARLKLKNPQGILPPRAGSRAGPKSGKSGTRRVASSSSNQPPAGGGRATQTRGKRKADGNDGGNGDAGDENDDDKPTSKRARTQKSSSKSSSTGKGNSPKTDDDPDNAGEGNDSDGTGSNAQGTPQLLLANKWDLAKGSDPTGWWISEKLDGVRTFYNGKQMISRLGNPFTPPQWFLDKLPKDITLDGELFGGRGQFQSTVSIVKTVNSPHWSGVTFQLFDIPSMGDVAFEVRYATLCKLFGPNGKYACKEVAVVRQELSLGTEHVLEKLKEVEQAGGEGLMLREPGSKYEGGRSRTLLKVKTFYDAEAIVIGHTSGTGKHKGVTGALVCQMESGKKFNCGSGLTDKQRKNPPNIGTIVVYRFQELTRDGVPRFPTFLGEAADKDKPKDAVVRPVAAPAVGDDAQGNE